MDKGTRLCATLAILGAGTLSLAPALAAPRKVPLPRVKPAVHVATASRAVVAAQAVPLPRNRPAVHAETPHGHESLRGPLPLTPTKLTARPSSGAFAVAATTATSAADLAALKRVIEAARKGRDTEADAAEKTIDDPVARKLAEWAILRADNTSPGFQRYAAFVAANPAWPHAALFRRRAEAALWNDHADDAAVRAYFADHAPVTAKGRYALARALLNHGDRERAAALVRYAWRHEDCSAEVEKVVLDLFGDLITRADDRIRMAQRFYDDDVSAGMRAAERLGGDDLLIGRARKAVIERARNAKAALDAVPSSARRDPGYVFARAQWLRKHDDPEQAGRLVLSVPQNREAIVDADAWWQERRLLVRKLLDDGDPHAAYRVARDSVPPDRANYRVDREFTAGWIALRFLHDPATAAAHFARIVEGTDNPHALSRGGYWQGRAAEAMGERAKARGFYEKAARFSATYYGQLARARLGLTELGLRGPPSLPAHERATLARLEVVRAVDLLFALDERDYIASIYAELGESASDVAGLAMLEEVAAKHRDARAMVLLGSAAYGRGLPLDYYAYPTMGLPDYHPIAPPLDPAVTYSIARQESRFNQKVVSPAHAMGLMQVTPEACQDTARRFKVTYSRSRLLSDPIYNVQMGAAELSNLLGGYNGSYLLTFAGYNAGRGRVRQWIAAYGDPRDPKVDPVDWVERIPISETRNYVQRIMENLQVYRARFHGGDRLLIEADIKRGKDD